MADRQQFLGQIQQQLDAWAQWLRDLEEQALKNARHQRVDAQAAYRLRAEHVRDLIRQGRVQSEQIAEAGDDAWEMIAGNAEQTWTALQDIAATLAMQSTPAANEATALAQPARSQSNARKPAAKAAVRRKSAAKKRKNAAKNKSRTAARKRAASKKAASTKARKQATRTKTASARKTSKKAASKRPAAKRKAGKAARRKK